MSWIRVLDVPHLQDRDELDLLPRAPALRNFSSLVSWIEDSFEIRFRRAHAKVRTTLPNAEDTIRLWVVASP